jgi:hypothetical protein
MGTKHLNDLGNSFFKLYFMIYGINLEVLIEF